jgi:uncharacterized protein YecE (DUF72 family)
MPLPANLYLGTVSWSKQDWLGPFYPPALKPSEFLATYARAFRAVEIDSTFYRVPSRSMVTGWRDRTAKGFVFAAKVPKVITHVKVLRECAEEIARFLGVMELLGEKLGPLLFQFPYFNKEAFASREQFEKVLRPVSRVAAERLPLRGRGPQQELDQSGFPGAAARALGGFRAPRPSLDAAHRRAGGILGFGNGRFLLCALYGGPERLGRQDTDLR